MEQSMNNVIAFPKNNLIQVKEHIKPSKSSFLAICYSELTNEDYIELLEAIACQDLYDEADDEIKELVNMFYDI